MSKKYRNIFACQDKIISYRFHKGVFEARYRGGGVDIFACAKTIEEMKRRFCGKFDENNYELQACNQSIPSNTSAKQNSYTKKALFMDYVEQWLLIKKQTVKESTYKEYERISSYNLKPSFGDKKIAEMTRPVIQEYLFGIVNEGKYRTAEKIRLVLVCVFDLISEDLGVVSPMKKIVLPYYQTKKGSSFTKAEEKGLVDYCIQNKDREASSALLVLLYFGLRRSELKSISIKDEMLTCITSKTKKGRGEVKRSIPFSPMFRRVVKYVDFEKVKTTNLNTLQTTLKRVFPNHHVHELRYTFITRAKESGCNQEVVMIWAGHSFDKDVRTSAVDRGYTDYSSEYMKVEAQKINYEI